MVSIGVVYNIPSPYREGFFEKLGALQDVDLKVYYCGVTQKGRLWPFKPGNYPFEILPGREFGNGLFLNPAVVSRILRSRHDAMVVAGYAYPTAILAMISALLNKSSMILWASLGPKIPALGLTYLIQSVKNQFKKRIVSLAHGCIVPGKEAQRQLEIIGANKEHIHIVPFNSLNMSWFRDEAARGRSEINIIRENLGIRAQQLLLYVGRLVEHKGVHYLLKAFAILKRRHPDLGLVIVGDGPYRPVLEEHCRTCELNDVHFLGELNYERLPKLYGICNLFVLPTLSDPWPLVILEAMASGLPVVLTNRAGSIPDLLSDMDDMIVEPERADPLAFAIENFLGLPSDSITALQSKVQRIASKYDHDIAARAFRDAVLEVKRD